MEILSLSTVALLILIWYFINLRNDYIVSIKSAYEVLLRQNAVLDAEADLAKRKAELDERQAQQDARQVQLDDRQAQLRAKKASRKEFWRKEKAHRRETRDREYEYYEKKRADLKYYKAQLDMKHKELQVVVGVMKKVLDTFTCGITQELFKDPVMLTNGQTYSKAAIQQWFRDNATCPNTRQNIWKRYYPNYAMQASIDAFREAWPAIVKFNEAVEQPNGPPAAEASAEAGAPDTA